MSQCPRMACNGNRALGSRLEKKMRMSVVTLFPQRRSDSTQTKLTRPHPARSGVPVAPQRRISMRPWSLPTVFS